MSGKLQEVITRAPTATWQRKIASRASAASILRPCTRKKHCRSTASRTEEALLEKNRRLIRAINQGEASKLKKLRISGIRTL
jgi:hypothetical protein